MKERKPKGEARFKMIKERHKKSLLKAISESKADKQMISLTKYISKTKNYFTSSCCSGRILLLNLDESETKRVGAFYRKWHSPTTFKEVWVALNEKTKDNLWFKQEPFCLLAGANNLENAQEFVKIARNSGIKRVGVIVLKEGKYLIELFGTSYLSVPVKKEDEILVEKEYLKYVVSLANKKLKKNFEALKKFERLLKKNIK
ncbi:MAG: hypothetical protein ABH821_04710 [archaeon]